MLGQYLLPKTEEFLDEIVNENRDENLDFAIESLRSLLEKEADGFTYTPSDELAYAVQCRLEEIWNLISTKEKKINFDLAEYYEDLLSEVEEYSGYEAERASSEDDDESDENEECDEDEMEECQC